MNTKTLSQKLFLRSGYQFIILNEPESYREILGELPEGAEERKKLSGGMDFIQYFVSKRKQLENDLPKIISNLKPEGLIWISYPKGTSKMPSDINRDIIWKIGDSLGIKGVSMISIDDTWSAFRFKKI